jgi:phage terminase small subunit
MRGRPPTPEHLKVVSITRGAKGPKNNLAPTLGCPKPSFLKRHAAGKVWNRLAPQLTELEILTELDGPLLANLCLLIYEMESDPGNMPTARMTEMRRILEAFGMNPITRPRLRLPAHLSYRRRGSSEDDYATAIGVR